MPAFIEGRTRRGTGSPINPAPDDLSRNLARNSLHVFGVSILAAGAGRAEIRIGHHERKEAGLLLRLRAMAKGRVTRRQKDISRLLREKKQIPPPVKIRKERKEKRK
jgi:hypothetical protein